MRDDASLDILLSTRDTITDFVDYLRSKEELLRSYKHCGVRFFYAGEEELLANYLLTLEDNRHGFAFPDGFNAIAIPEGDWGHVVAPGPNPRNEVSLGERHEIQEVSR